MTWPPEGYELAPGGGIRPTTVSEFDRRTGQAVDDAPNGVMLTKLSAVDIKRPKFAWDPWMPLGTITLVAGIPGQGKSHLVVYLGAQVTRGTLDGDLRGEPADVVVASAEDAASFVLKPRFLAAGADLDRVHIVQVHRDGLDLGLTIPDDLEQLRAVMERVRARLLIVDPLLAHIPVRIDGYKDQHVRVALAPMARMAEDLDAAIASVMHLNKRETSDLFSRIGGSGGFLAAARSGLLVGPDPDDEDGRVIVHGKANLTRQAESLAFRLQPVGIETPEGTINVARVAITGASDHGVGDVLAQMNRTPEAREAAVRWLNSVLRTGPQPVTWIRSQAEVEGHAWRTVERAKALLGVTSDRVGGIAGEGSWEWSLPR